MEFLKTIFYNKQTNYTVKIQGVYTIVFNTTCTYNNSTVFTIALKDKDYRLYLHFLIYVWVLACRLFMITVFQERYLHRYQVKGIHFLRNWQNPVTVYDNRHRVSF